VAFRSFADWTEPPARARRVVTRLRCIGPLDPADVAEIRAMKHLRELVLEGVETFPLGLCDLGDLRALTVNAPGEPINGRAMTRPTSCLPRRISRAVSQILYSSNSGMTSSCAATWKTLSADV